MTHGDAVDAEHLLDLVAHVLVQGFLAVLLVQLDGFNEGTIVLAGSFRRAVTHFNCKIYSIQLKSVNMRIDEWRSFDDPIDYFFQLVDFS